MITNNINHELFQAIISGDLSRTKALIEEGANHNNTNELGQTPLTIAIKNGKLEIVQYLLDCGSDIKINDQTGNLPSAYTKCLEILALLNVYWAKSFPLPEDSESDTEHENSDTEGEDNLLRVPVFNLDDIHEQLSGAASETESSLTSSENSYVMVQEFTS